MSMSRIPADRRSAFGCFRMLAPIGVLVGVMWALELLDSFVGNRLDGFGIIPRTGDGLFGIVAAPFLHLGFGHLLANTGALLVLGGLILLTTSYFWMVTLAVALFGGMGVWLTGDPFTVVIGASGLVYGYAAYLVFLGVFHRRLRHVLVAVFVAVLVVLLYDGLVIGMLPVQPGVSWQAHLFGALAGVAVARWHANLPGSLPGRR
ncbi:MAG: rhomboid family intramembrane serine protease [Propionibacteriales bacterium]|nr:rhomboid family intramembrane serine protease [Propionibacteriales bacterium]